MSATNGHLALYMFSLFITALPFSSVGPLIPFMAQQLGIDETEYSVMFIWISVATFTAAIIYKILGKYRLLPSFHTTLIVCCLEMAIFSVVFTFMKTKNTQIIIISIIKLFNYIYVVGTNICLMIAPPKKEIGLWMSFSHGAYGFGSLGGPILVGFLEQKVFYVIAAACLLIIPIFFFLTSPENMVKSAEQQQLHDNSKAGSVKLELLISIGLFVLVGLQSTISNWIPTYAVQNEISTKQGAVQFASIFWILESLFRFVFAYLPGKDSTKLTISCWSQLVAGAICVVMSILHHQMESAYLSSILYGIALSMGFPLLLSISHEYGIHFDGDAISNMMISCTISVGVYSTLTGILMKSTPEMYHYSMLGYSVLMLLIFFAIMYMLRKESEEAKETKGLPIPQQ